MTILKTISDLAQLPAAIRSLADAQKSFPRDPSHAAYDAMVLKNAKLSLRNSELESMLATQDNELAAQESELARLREFARWHSEIAPRNILVVIRAPARADDLLLKPSNLLPGQPEWRYARLEDVP
jgi:hypothetical protein